MDIEDFAAVFGVLAIFLVALTIGTAVILVAGRMAAQIRQVGTLKAVGSRPARSPASCSSSTSPWPSGHRGRAGRRHSAGAVPGPCHRCWPCTGPRPTDHVATRRDRVRRHHRRRAPGHGAARAARRAAQHPALPRQQHPATPPPRPADACDDRAAAPPAGMAGARGASRRRGRFLANTLGLTVGITLLITALALRTGVDSFRRQGAPRRSRPDLLCR